MAFEYPSNFSNGTAVIDPGTFAQYANYVSDNNLGYAFIVVIYFITFALGLTLGAGRAMLFSSFVSLIFSVWLFRIGILPVYALYIFMVLLILGIVMSKGERSNI